MKKIITLTAALALCGSALADDYTLYYDSNDGESSTLISRVQDIQKLTFENGHLVTTLRDGSRKSTAISSIKRMFISSQTTGIESVSDKEEKRETGNTTATYDLTGRKTDSGKGALRKGIYIANGKKILVK